MYGIPALSEPAVVLPRVWAALDARVPLTIVRAPSGSGKSVQLASWARALESSVDVVWIDLKEHPTQPFTNLRDHMEHNGGQQTIIIFDNVSSLVDQDQTGIMLAEFEREMLSWLAANHRAGVYLLTRIVLELETQLAMLAYDSVFVGLSELALTAEEVDRIGTSRNFPSSNLHAEAICDASDGLPGPVQQYYASFDPSDAQQYSVFTRTDPVESVGALLAPHLLGRLAGRADPALSVVASLIAATRRANPQAIHEILQNSASIDNINLAVVEDSIATLELAGYLYGRMVAGVVDYGIPQPWARALGHSFPAAKIPSGDTLRLTALWCLDNGNAVDALSLALEAGDLELAGEVTFRRPADLESTDPARWAHQISKQGLRKLSDHPLLLMQLGLGDIRMRGYAGNDPGYFALAARSARRSDHLGLGRRGTISDAGLAVIEAVAEHTGGSPTAALRAAHTSLGHIERLGSEQRLSISGVLPAWLIEIGQVFMDSGHLATAETCFRDGDSAALGFMNVPSKFHAQCLLALCMAQNGNITESLKLVGVIESGGWPTVFSAGYVGDALRLAKAIIHLEHQELDRAAGQLADVVDVRSRVAYRYAMVMTAELLAQASGTAASSPKPTGTHIDDRRQLLPETRSEIAAGRAYRALMMGQVSEATELLKDVALHTDLVRMVSLRLALSQRDDHTFVQMLQPATVGNSKRWQLSSCLLQVVFALRTGDREAAESLMVPTLRSMKAKGLQTPWLILTQEEQSLVEGLNACGVMRIPDLPVSSWTGPAMLIDPLTLRERHTLDLLVKFASVRDIAAELFVSVNTAKTHIRSIYRKLGAISRSQALVRASALGLVRSQAPLVDEKVE